MELTQDKLDRAFKRVRKWYFKDWQPSREWKAVMVEKISDGSFTRAWTNSKTHTIEVRKSGFLYVEDIETLLIHEIAHATSRADWHSKPWQNEMGRVIRLAEDKGWDAHSERLQTDLDWYVQGHEK